jgi:hypothetical protein
MAGQDPWFFEERAVAFAKLLLTAHNDVRVQPPAGPDTAGDLLVGVLKDGKPALRSPLPSPDFDRRPSPTTDLQVITIRQAPPARARSILRRFRPHWPLRQTILTGRECVDPQVIVVISRGPYARPRTA